MEHYLIYHRKKFQVNHPVNKCIESCLVFGVCIIFLYSPIPEGRESQFNIISVYPLRPHRPASNNQSGETHFLRSINQSIISAMGTRWTICSLFVTQWL